MNKCTNNEEFKITRRHLPHWTMKYATYFITARLIKDKLSIDEQKLVLEHITAGNRKYYILIAAIVMPDHTHLILRPREGYSLSRIMKGIKGTTSRQINFRRKTSGSIWQDESFDRIIRDENELYEKINYMVNNPVKRGLTDEPWHYHGWYYNEEYEIELVGQTFLSDPSKKPNKT